MSTKLKRRHVLLFTPRERSKGLTFLRFIALCFAWLFIGAGLGGLMLIMLAFTRFIHWLAFP